MSDGDDTDRIADRRRHRRPLRRGEPAPIRGIGARRPAGPGRPTSTRCGCTPCSSGGTAGSGRPVDRAGPDRRRWFAFGAAADGPGAIAAVVAHRRRPGRPGIVLLARGGRGVGRRDSDRGAGRRLGRGPVADRRQGDGSAPRAIRCASGMLRLAFDSGAMVTLEGPADLRILSGMRLRAVRGRITARMKGRAQGIHRRDAQHAWSSTRGPSSAWRSTPPAGPASSSSRAWWTFRATGPAARRLGADHDDSARARGCGLTGRASEPDHRRGAPTRRRRMVDRSVVRGEMRSSGRSATTSGDWRVPSITRSSTAAWTTTRRRTSTAPTSGTASTRAGSPSSSAVPITSCRSTTTSGPIDLEITVELARRGHALRLPRRPREAAVLAHRAVHGHRRQHRPRRGVVARPHAVHRRSRPRPEHQPCLLGLEARR